MLFSIPFFPPRKVYDNWLKDMRKKGYLFVIDRRTDRRTTLRLVRADSLSEKQLLVAVQSLQNWDDKKMTFQRITALFQISKVLTQQNDPALSNVRLAIDADGQVEGYVVMVKDAPVIQKRGFASGPAK